MLLCCLRSLPLFSYVPVGKTAESGASQVNQISDLRSQIPDPPRSETTSKRKYLVTYFEVYK